MSHKLLIIPILLISLILNIYSINWGLPDREHLHPSFHPDETSSIESSLSILKSSRTLYPSPTALGNGAMQFYIVAIIYKIGSTFRLLNLSPENSADLVKLYLTGRIVTLVMSILMVFFFFSAVSLVFNFNTALISSLLLVSIPGIVISSHYFRSEIPALFWIVLAFYFLVKLYRNKILKFYLLAAMSIGFATSTKYNSFPIIVLLIVAHIFTIPKKQSNFIQFFFDKKLIYSYIVIIFAFIVGSIGILFYFDEFKQQLFKQVFYYQKGNMLESTGMGPAWIGYFTQILPYSLTIPVQVLSIVGLFWAFVKRRRWEIFLAIWTIVYYFAMSNANFWLVRYTIPLLPALTALIGHFIIDAPKQKSLKIIFLFLGFIIISISFTNSIILDSVRTAKDPRHAAYDWIRENVPEGKKIGLDLTPAVFYNQAEDNENQMITVYPSESGKQLIFHKRFDAYHNRYQPVVMRLNENLLAQIDYYIANDQVYLHYLRLPNLFPVESRYFNKIFNSGQFKKVAEFENPISLFGWKISKGYPPHDFMYFMPRITVYQRIVQDTLK